MVKMDEDTIRSVRNLANNENFKVFLEWMKTSMIEQSLKNNYTDDDLSNRRNQGANRELETIIKEVERAKIPTTQSPGPLIY